MLIKKTVEMTEPERIATENSNNQFLQAISYITIGSVFLYAGTSIPENFMVCDGRSLDTTEYAELFNIIGYKFGGSEDIFKLPNLSSSQVLNCNYIIKTNDSISKTDFRFPIDYFYNPKSENALSGIALASALGNYLPIDREIEIELEGGDAGGNVEIEFVVDDAMSDTSSNPVENRVVKQYIDAVDNKAADYDVEEGTKTITHYIDNDTSKPLQIEWHYRKKKNGEAECWFNSVILFDSAEDSKVSTGIPTRQSNTGELGGGIFIVSTILDLPLEFVDRPAIVGTCGWVYTEWLQTYPTKPEGKPWKAHLRLFCNSNSYHAAIGVSTDTANTGGAMGIPCNVVVKGRWK